MARPQRTSPSGPQSGDKFDTTIDLAASAQFIVTTISVPGARTTDAVRSVHIEEPAVAAMESWVSAEGVVSIKLYNSENTGLPTSTSNVSGELARYSS